MILEPLSLSFHSGIFRAGSPAMLGFENVGLLQDLLDRDSCHSAGSELCCFLFDKESRQHAFVANWSLNNCLPRVIS